MADKMVTTTTQRAGTPSLAVSLLFLSASLLLQSGCKKADDSADKPVVTVQAVHPTSGSITEEIDADAILAPVAQAAILPKVTAPVRKFYVQRGSHVKAGQLVATLENEDLAAAAMDNKGAFDAAQGAYATATQSAVPEEQTRSRLDLEQAKATLDLDNSILEARKQLLAQGAIPGRDYDTARTTALQAQAAYDIAKQKYEALTKVGTSASLESAKGTLASAKGKYLGAQAQLSYTNIRTPISGVVTDRPLFAGETAAAGTPVVTVMDTSFMIAKLHVAQIQAQRLSLGSPATITVPGVEEPVDAKVSLISPALDPGSTTVEVWLRVPNSKGHLKAGTSVRATLKGKTVENALLIPTEAVQRSPEGAGKIVMVVGADGAAAKRAVTVGIQTDESAEILSGLKPSDTVITTGGYGLDEGTKVKVGPAEEKGSAGKSDDDAGGK
ncbi:efflux RND transporter periplasmic adaptor subunit [Tunturibacter empetritectus]|uniref:Efflux RND transporter periplasmic adaptor subunit n=1 Tax=Tunturiibacter empetritectus TaxID=3069691 RepID=A0AAU7Z9J2_9BACT